MKIKKPTKLPTLQRDRAYSSAFFLVEAMIGARHGFRQCVFLTHPWETGHNASPMKLFNNKIL